MQANGIYPETCLIVAALFRNPKMSFGRAFIIDFDLLVEIPTVLAAIIEFAFPIETICQSLRTTVSKAVI